MRVVETGTQQKVGRDLRALLLLCNKVGKWSAAIHSQVGPTYECSSYTQLNMYLLRGSPTYLRTSSFPCPQLVCASAPLKSWSTVIYGHFLNTPAGGLSLGKFCWVCTYTRLFLMDGRVYMETGRGLGDDRMLHIEI